MKIHRKKTLANYTVISNNCLKDKELSWKAKGLISYLMSLPDDWKICIEDLKNRSTDGKDSTASAIKELIKNGYCQRMRERKSDGTFGDFAYFISDSKQPKTDFPTLVKPDTVKPSAVKPSTVNPSLLSTNITSTNILSTNKANTIKESSENEFSPPPLLKKSIEERKKDFYGLIAEKIKGTDYAKTPSEIRKFYEYWIEHGESDKKMRFEKQVSFSVLRRLNTWFDSAKKFNTEQNNQQSILSKKLKD